MFFCTMEAVHATPPPFSYTFKIVGGGLVVRPCPVWYVLPCQLLCITTIAPPTSKKRHPDYLTCWWEVHKKIPHHCKPLWGTVCGLTPQKPCLQACQDKSFLHRSCPRLLQTSRVQAGGTSPMEITALTLLRGSYHVAPFGILMIRSSVMLIVCCHGNYLHV